MSSLQSAIPLTLVLVQMHILFQAMVGLFNLYNTVLYQAWVEAQVALLEVVAPCKKRGLRMSQRPPPRREW